MPTSLRARLRGSGGRVTPLEYMLLALTAVVLVTLVFFALGRLVNNQLDCGHKPDTAASATAARC